jgi:hypothetical protein
MEMARQHPASQRPQFFGKRGEAVVEKTPVIVVLLETASR